MAKRASYKEALYWIAAMDDWNFLDDESPIPSVTVCMVADLWGKTDAEVMRDLRKTIKNL